MKKIDSAVKFSPDQLDWLEKQFPVVVLGPSTPESSIHHYFGQQSVLERIRKLTWGVGNVQQSNSIPSPGR